MFKSNEMETILEFIQNFHTVSKEQLFFILHNPLTNPIKDEKHKQIAENKLNYLVNQLIFTKVVTVQNDLIIQTGFKRDTKIVNALWTALTLCDDISTITPVSLPFHVGFIKADQFYQVAFIDKAVSIPIIQSYANSIEVNAGKVHDVYQYILVVDNYETAASIEDYELNNNYQIAVVEYDENNQFYLDLL